MNNGFRKKFWHFIDKAEDYVGGFMFFLMIFFTGINVFFYWCFGRKYAELEEIVMASYVWVTYLCLGSHVIDHTSISVDFMLLLLPEKLKKLFAPIRDIACLVLGTVIFYLGTKLMIASVNKRTPIIKISYSWIELGLVIGILVLILRIINKYIPGGEEKKVLPAALREAEEA